MTLFLHSTSSFCFSNRVPDKYWLWRPDWTIQSSRDLGRWGFTSCSLCLQEFIQQHTNYTGFFNSLKVGNMFGGVFGHELKMSTHNSQSTGRTMCFISYVSKRWQICTNSDCFGPFFPETEPEIELYVTRFLRNWTLIIISGEGTAKGSKRKFREPPRNKKARYKEFADLQLGVIPGLLVTRITVTTIQTHEEYQRSLALREQAARNERSRALLQALCGYIEKGEAEEITAYGAKLDPIWDECWYVHCSHSVLHAFEESQDQLLGIPTRTMVKRQL